MQEHNDNTYVDDCFSVITSNKNKLWNKIEDYIKKMNNYYLNNRLQMNIKKTLVMIISNMKEEHEEQLIIYGNVIKHNNMIKILGITFNDQLNWNK